MRHKVRKCASRVSQKQADLILAIAALATESRARWPGWICFWFFGFPENLWMTSPPDISHSVSTSMQHFLCAGSRTWSPLAATGDGPGWMCTTDALVKMDLTSSLYSRGFTTFLSDWETLLMPKRGHQLGQVQMVNLILYKRRSDQMCKSTVEWFFKQTVTSDCYCWQLDGQGFIQRAGEQTREDNLVLEKTMQV